MTRPFFASLLLKPEHRPEIQDFLSFRELLELFSLSREGFAAVVLEEQHFREQICDFPLEAANIPEDTLVFLLNFILHAVGSEI